MDAGEIREAIGAFGKAARRCVDAGFDGVQIHAAHGYLVSQFLSRLANRRTDEWGGSLTNRARLLREIYLEIRSRLGDDAARRREAELRRLQRGRLHGRGGRPRSPASCRGSASTSSRSAAAASARRRATGRAPARATRPSPRPASPATARRSVRPPGPRPLALVDGFSSLAGMQAVVRQRTRRPRQPEQALHPGARPRREARRGAARGDLHEVRRLLRLLRRGHAALRPGRAALTAGAATGRPSLGRGCRREPRVRSSSARSPTPISMSSSRTGRTRRPSAWRPSPPGPDGPRGLRRALAQDPRRRGRHREDGPRRRGRGGPRRELTSTPSSASPRSRTGSVASTGVAASRRRRCAPSSTS